MGTIAALQVQSGIRKYGARYGYTCSAAIVPITVDLAEILHIVKAHHKKLFNKVQHKKQ